MATKKPSKSDLKSLYEFILFVFDKETKSDLKRGNPSMLLDKMNESLKCSPSLRPHSGTSQSMSRKGCPDSTLKPSCVIPPFKPSKIKRTPAQPSLRFKVDCPPPFLANADQKSKFILEKEPGSNLSETSSFKFRLTQMGSSNESESGSNIPVQSAEDSVPLPSCSNQMSQGSPSSSPQKQYSPPPMTSSDVSMLDESSSQSGSSSRSPSPIQSPSSSCRRTPLTTPCPQTSRPACDLNFCSSYDKELQNVRMHQEELFKLEEAKKREVGRLNLQVESVKRKELEIKRQEFKLLKKRDKERRREEMRQLECLKKEETRKLEIEFLYRQNCLQEEHDMELELLRRKEAEIKAYQTERYVSPTPEPCEIEKIDRTLESIEAVFAECNDQYQKNKKLCSMKNDHNKPLENLNNDRVEECPNDSHIKSGANVSHMNDTNKIPSTSQYDNGPYRKCNPKNTHSSKTSKPSFSKDKIIIKHESMACNGGDCCGIGGPTCSVIPTFGTKKQSRVKTKLENCGLLCRFCQQDINRDTNNPCCLDERRRSGNNLSYMKHIKSPKDKKNKKKHFFRRDSIKTMK